MRGNDLSLHNASIHVPRTSASNVALTSDAGGFEASGGETSATELAPSECAKRNAQWFKLFIGMNLICVIGTARSARRLCGRMIFEMLGDWGWDCYCDAVMGIMVAVVVEVVMMIEATMMTITVRANLTVVLCGDLHAHKKE
jgi:hypothetical protein